MPLISVIIPCYNSELHVGRAIESVLNQSFKDFEIILVNNNSSDATATVLQRYADANPGIIKVLQEPINGAPFARNRGLSEAAGEWLQFLDSDDEILPDKFQHQLDLTKADGTIGLVVGSFYDVRTNKDGLSKKIVPVSSGNPWKSLIESHLGKTSSMLWKKEVVKAAGGWNTNLTSSQEYDLLFRVLKNNVKIEYSHVPQTIYYVLNNSISRSANDDRMIDILNNYVNLRMKIKDYLKSTGKYSRELDKAVSTTIFLKLSLYEKRIPGYVKKKKEEINLKVSIEFRIRYRARKFKNNLKKLIKNTRKKSQPIA